MNTHIRDVTSLHAVSKIVKENRYIFKAAVSTTKFFSVHNFGDKSVGEAGAAEGVRGLGKDFR
jgi:hypothetical protein